VGDSRRPAIFISKLQGNAEQKNYLNLVRWNVLLQELLALQSVEQARLSNIPVAFDYNLHCKT
jgi:hypothetical protein